MCVMDMDQLKSSEITTKLHLTRLVIINLWGMEIKLHFRFAFQDSLPEKLAIYEKDIEEFDAFVDTLQ